jgi:hypothetical protein
MSRKLKCACKDIFARESMGVQHCNGLQSVVDLSLLQVSHSLFHGGCLLRGCPTGYSIEGLGLCRFGLDV